MASGDTCDTLSPLNPLLQPQKQAQETLSHKGISCAKIQLHSGFKSKVTSPGVHPIGCQLFGKWKCKHTFKLSLVPCLQWCRESAVWICGCLKMQDTPLLQMPPFLSFQNAYFPADSICLNFSFWLRDLMAEKLPKGQNTPAEFILGSLHWTKTVNRSLTSPKYLMPYSEMQVLCLLHCLEM